MKQSMTQSSSPGCWETRTRGRGRVFFKLSALVVMGPSSQRPQDLKAQGCKKRVGESASVSAPVKQ